MNPSHALRWSQYFDEVTTHLSSVCISTPGGDSLFLRPTTLSDVGTLPLACQTITQFFKLKNKQIVLVNDPSSGGTTLQTLTLVAGVSIGSSSDADLVVASRFRVRPTLMANTATSLRIPPTPIVGFEGFQTQDILTAISQHPGAQKDLKERIETEIKKLEWCVELMNKTAREIISVKKQNIESFLKISQERHSRYLDEVPFESVMIQKEFDKGGKIQLQISNTSNGLMIDFLGTETPYKCTYAMTVGACVGAINSFLRVELPLNHGHLRNVTVHTPTQSPLNASPQVIQPEGELILVPLVANAVVEGFSRMLKKMSYGECGLSLFIELHFKSGATFFERLPGGTGGSYLQSGLDGVDVWTRLPLQPSIEDMESRFPLSIVRSERRTGSGGRGVKMGGSGSRRTFHFEEAGTLFWALEQARVKPNGTEGGSSGDGNLLTLHRASGETVDLTGTGKIAVEANDTLTLLSAGGGGYGRLE